MLHKNFLVTGLFLAVTTAALAANAPATPVSKLKVGIDAKGLSPDTHVSVIKKQANRSDEPPFMNGEPEHLQVSFGNDKLKDYTDCYSRQMQIYPVAPYAALFKGKEKAAFDPIVPALKKLIASKSFKSVKEIPILPAVEAAQVFHGQQKVLNFKDGAGVAFLTSYSQEQDAPIHDGDYFYTFQGLTADGKYYLALYYPVKARGLSQTLPTAKAVSYLSGLKPERFTPALSTINSMVESISIKQ